MKRTFISRIYFVFLAGWIFALPLYIGLLICCAWGHARHYENDLYANAAPEFARILMVEEGKGRSLEESFHWLRRLSPDLEPYLLNQTGTIAYALRPESIGIQIPGDVLNNRLSGHYREPWYCAVDPEGELLCPTFAAARLRFQGKDSILYLLVRRGPSAQLEQAIGIAQLLQIFIPGFVISFLFSVLIAFITTRTFARDIINLAALITEYARLNFRSRFIPRREDETAIVGRAVNVLADAFERHFFELRQSAAERKHLLARVVHDFRKPLSVMTLLLERAPRALASKNPEERNRLVEKMERTLHSQQKILDDLRPLSPTAGLSPLTSPFLETSVQEILNEVIQQLSPLFQRKNISLQIIEESSPPKVLASTQDLFRVFLNLLDNALQYTPESGEVKVELSNKNGACSIRFIDTGIGIPLEEQKKVFEPRFRSTSAEQVNPQGTGLGLATVSRSVRQSGGYLELNSTPGLGTVVELLLPTTEQPSLPQTMLPSEDAAHPKKFTHCNGQQAFPFFELCIFLTLLIEIFIDSHFFNAHRPPAWSLAATLLFFVFGILLFIDLKGINLRELNIWIRSGAGLSFGLTWLIGRPENDYILPTLPYIALSGLLLGNALAIRPFVPQGIAAGVPLLCALVLQVADSTKPIAFILPVFCAICSFTIAHQQYQRKARFYSRRLFGMLFGVFLLGFLPHFYLANNSNESHGAYFDHRPLRSNDTFALTLSAETRALVKTSIDAANFLENLNELFFRLELLRPQNELYARCNSSDPRFCATSPIAFDRLSERSVTEMLDRTGRRNQQRIYAVSGFPLPEAPEITVYVNPISALSTKILQRSCQPYVASFIAGGILISLLQSIWILLSCFERYRRGLTRLAQSVLLMSSGKPTHFSPEHGWDELSAMERAIVDLQSHVDYAEMRAIEVKSETSEFIAIISKTLEEQRKHFHLSMSRNIDDVRSLENLNARSSSIIDEVFRYSLFLSETLKFEPMTLADLIRETNHQLFERDLSEPDRTFAESRIVRLHRASAVCGLRNLLKSLDSGISATHEPDLSLQSLTSLSILTVTDVEWEIRIRTKLDLEVDAERQALWALGTRMLDLSGGKISFAKDCLAGELQVSLRIASSTSPSSRRHYLPQGKEDLESDFLF